MKLRRYIQIEDRRLTLLERKWSARIYKALREQGKYYIENGTINNSMSDTLSELYQEIMLPEMQRQYELLSKNKLQKKDKFFLRWQRKVTEVLLTKLFNRSVEIDKTTIRDIKEVVESASITGETVGSIADAIQRVTSGRYGRNRAKMVARTELGNAVAIAKEESSNTWSEETGMRQGKLWIHRGAKDPRSWHMALDTGVAIPKETPFIVTDPNTGITDNMNYPHDENSSAGNVINCGCTIVYVPYDENGNNNWN